MISPLAISIVGAGSLASALGPALRQAGYRIDEILTRDQPSPASLRRARTLAKSLRARAASISAAKLECDVLWFGVNDSAIRPCAEALAQRQRQVSSGKAARRYAFHSSGALGSEELEPLRKQGWRVASLHPMMTFVRGYAPALAGVSFAAEGDRAALAPAKQIVARLGGKLYGIHPAAKSLYHAWGAFGSPLLVIELAIAERVAAAAGVSPASARKRMEPLVRQTMANYFRLGAAASFSGPMARGDTDTIRKHLQALIPVVGAASTYIALARAGLEDLPVGDKHGLLMALQEANLEVIRALQRQISGPAKVRKPPWGEDDWT